MRDQSVCKTISVKLLQRVEFPSLQWFEIDSNFHNWPEDCADDGHDDDDNIKDDDDDERPLHHGEKQYTRTSSI